MSVHLPEHCVKQPAGCRKNMGVVAAGGLHLHGRLGLGCNPGGEWGASAPLQRSSAAPEGLALAAH